MGVGAAESGIDMQKIARAKNRAPRRPGQASSSTATSPATPDTTATTSRVDTAEKAQQEKELQDSRKELAVGVGEIGRAVINGQTQPVIDAWNNGTGKEPAIKDKYKTPEERAGWEAIHRGESALLHHAGLGTLKTDTMPTDGKYDLDSVNERQVPYRREKPGEPGVSETGNIRKVTAVAGDVFTCEVEVPDGNGGVKTEPWENIPREKAQAALLLGEKEHILGLEGFQGEAAAKQKDVADMYIQDQAGEKPFESFIPEQINALNADVLTVANEVGQGIRSGAIAKDLVNKLVPPNMVNVAVSQENAGALYGDLTWREAALDRLDGKTIIDFDTFLFVYGYKAPEQVAAINQQITSLKTQEQQLQKAGKTKELGETRRERGELQAQRILLNQLATIEGQKTVREAFNKLSEGVIDPKALGEAAGELASGNVAGALGKLIPEATAREEAEFGRNLKARETYESSRKWGKRVGVSMVALTMGLGMLAKAADD